MKHLMSILSLLSIFSCHGAYTDLKPADFAAKAQEVVLLDVRTADEYAAGHLRGAANIDWFASSFMSQVEAAFPKGTPLAVYCRSGKRSAAAAAKLSKAGYSVYNMVGGYIAWTEAGLPITQYEVETFITPGDKPVKITLIKHGTLAIEYDGLSIHVDPVSGLGKPTDYATEFKKADIILVTHEHFDHFDKEAIASLTDEHNTLITNSRCAEMLGYGTVMANGDVAKIAGITLQAVPAYNYSEGHTQFHPKGRDNGFVLTVDGLKIYIAGDTEDIPEMADIKDVDIAFLPVNQPYTMTVEQCVNAAKLLNPKVLIPYHFSQTDLSELPSFLPDVNVLLRQMQ